MSRSTPFLFVLVFLFVNTLSIAGEYLNRGLVALPQAEGVYIGWRLLKEDTEKITFNLYRKSPEARKWTKLNKQPILNSTNFMDIMVVKGERYVYQLETGSVKAYSDTILYNGQRQTYISIGLNGDYDFQKCAIADLDGDGSYDFVIKTPDVNIDPMRNKRSDGTYKLEAYKSDGKYLWQHDMGWGITTGVWFSPYIAYDADHDGKAEVYTKYSEGDPRDDDGVVRKGDEYLAKLNGETGALIRKVNWPNRHGFVRNVDNHSNRNFLSVAYLDGERASVIVLRGTYDIIKSMAFDGNLNYQWYWDSRMEEKKYWHQGSHGLFIADIDGDNKEEIVYGSAALDNDGKGLWTLEMGHCDQAYVGDLDPDRPGLEVFYGFETSQWRNGIGQADARTGEFYWGERQPVKHVHSTGMCADLFAEYPGLECYGGEKDGSNFWLFDARGNRIHDKNLSGLGPKAVRWDKDVQHELIREGKIIAHGVELEGAELLDSIEGKIVGIADILGDWREEIITSVKGELRVYSTAILSDKRYACLMQDRLYRSYVTNQSMGYFYQPVLGIELK